MFWKKLSNVLNLKNYWYLIATVITAYVNAVSVKWTMHFHVVFTVSKVVVLLIIAGVGVLRMVQGKNLSSFNRPDASWEVTNWRAPSFRGKQRSRQIPRLYPLTDKDRLRAFHSMEWTLHAREWTLHAREWTLHAREWTLHAREWTLHAREWTLHAREWTLHAPEWTLHAREWTAARARMNAARARMNAARARMNAARAHVLSSKYRWRYCACVDVHHHA